MSARLRAVLFDLDGTLVDSVEDLASAVNAAREGLGFERLAVPAVRRMIGDGMQVLLSRAIPDASLVPRAIELFRAHYAAHLVDRTRAYDGIPGALEALRADGLGLGVVTNKPEGFSRTILARTDLARLVEVVIGADSGHGKKPEAGPVLAALEALGARPAEALLVGDGPNDILGARAAGVRSVGVGWGIADPAEVRALGPDWWVERPEELARVTSWIRTRKREGTKGA